MADLLRVAGHALAPTRADRPDGRPRPAGSRAWVDLVQRDERGRVLGGIAVEAEVVR